MPRKAQLFSLMFPLLFVQADGNCQGDDCPVAVNSLIQVRGNSTVMRTVSTPSASALAVRDKSATTYVAESTIKGANRGVFAAKDLAQCEHIETSRTIQLGQFDYSPFGLVGRYVFMHPTDENKSVVVLGDGSLMNHAGDQANVAYRPVNPDDPSSDFEFYAIQLIKKGEELFVDYGYDVDLESIRAAEDDPSLLQDTEKKKAVWSWGGPGLAGACPKGKIWRQLGTTFAGRTKWVCRQPKKCKGCVQDGTSLLDTTCPVLL